MATCAAPSPGNTADSRSTIDPASTRSGLMAVVAGLRTVAMWLRSGPISRR